MSEPRPGPGDRAVYVISVVAEIAGVHPQTLRMYERKGLLEPKRTEGNSRRYSERDVARLNRIQALTQNAGVNLAGVRIIIDLEHRLERMQVSLEKATRMLADSEAELTRRRESRGVLVRLSDVRDIFAAGKGIHARTIEKH
ncbi:MAG: heat shock protein transcriptional repressor HspR [Actinomycetota bacterium]